MADELDAVACCACLEVVYAPKDNGDGTLIERWWCKNCHAQFVRGSRLIASNRTQAARIEEMGKVLDDAHHAITMAVLNEDGLDGDEGQIVLDAIMKVNPDD